MQFFIILIAIFLVSCSSSQKISLGNASSSQKSKKFIVDDTRYYGSRDRDRFYRIDDDDFDPKPIYKLDSLLSETLSADADAKAVRVKKLAVYFSYSRSEISTKAGAQAAGGLVASGVGVLVGGMLAEQSLLSKENSDSTDRQTVGCDFLARYKGRIIEFYIDQQVCEGNHVFCVKSPSIEDPRIKTAAEKVAHSCMDKALAKIKELQNLPPLAESDIEYR